MRSVHKPGWMTGCAQKSWIQTGADGIEPPGGLLLSVGAGVVGVGRDAEHADHQREDVVVASSRIFI